MVKDAESHSAEDKKRREVIEIKNHADQLVYSMEKLLRENKEKIPAADAERVQQEIEATKKAIQSENAEQIKKAMDSLTQASHKLTEMMYQQASQAQPQPGPQGEPQAGGQPGESAAGSDGDVIDAEVVDDKKSN